MELARIDSDSMVDLVFHLKWKSDRASHTDGYQASRINIWRDFLPPTVQDEITGRQAGERLEVRLKADDILPKHDEKNLFDIKNNQFNPRMTIGKALNPNVGRFYPKGLLKGVSGVFKANIQPFRCVHLNNGHMKIDFNHPLSGKDLVLSGVVGKVENKGVERGGSSVDWMNEVTSGPGMQARWRDRQTDFFSAKAMQRQDESPDIHFYGEPRYVQHIDDTAIEMVKNTYGRFLKDEMRVLDLMSSWQSHLPDKLRLKRLVGLGLNERELKRNRLLSEQVVQDLNRDPRLPFGSDSFDAVVCTVSIEYLTDPLAVFDEVSRILQPGGHFIVTFSNRWFPTKAIKIWQELHEFERMGMVLECFLRSGGYHNLQTYSIRGLPRPHDDMYFPDLQYSDPVYAIWGQKK